MVGFILARSKDWDFLINHVLQFSAEMIFTPLCAAYKRVFQYCI